MYDMQELYRGYIIRIYKTTNKEVEEFGDGYFAEMFLQNSKSKGKIIHVSYGTNLSEIISGLKETADYMIKRNQSINN